MHVRHHHHSSSGRMVVLFVKSIIRLLAASERNSVAPSTQSDSCCMQFFRVSVAHLHNEQRVHIVALLQRGTPDSAKCMQNVCCYARGSAARCWSNAGCLRYPRFRHWPALPDASRCIPCCCMPSEPLADSIHRGRGPLTVS